MIGFVGSRWLGFRCAEVAKKHLWGMTWQERREIYPGDPTPEQVRELGVEEKTISELVANCHVILNVLGGHVFSAAELAACEVINLHCAPLPELPGLAPFEEGLKGAYYAVTLHHCDETIDTGPVIARKWLPVHEADTTTDLYRRSQVAALELFQQRIWDFV